MADSRRWARASTVGAVAVLLLLAACRQENQYVAPPPPSVTVAVPVQRPVTRYLELTGTTAAVNSADLVARVPGFVEGISFEDGAHVKKGDLLFTIEPEPYDVKLSQAQAAEAGAQASLKQAQAEFDRQTALVSSQTATRAQYDQALANRDAAQAGYLQAQANTKLAAINAAYARVKSPLDGIVAARQVSVGAYVGGSASPTLLASVVQTDPIYVNFSVSEGDVLELRAWAAARGFTRDDLKKAPVEIGLQNDIGYPHAGTLDYVAPAVDATTGTLAARAVFQNGDRILLPGYFVRVRIPVEQRPKALLVPETAIGSDQGGRYVLIVGKDKAVERRGVKIGQASEGGLRVVEDGLAPDDQVVVTGAAQAIPGQKVEPKLQAAAAAAAGSP